MTTKPKRKKRLPKALEVVVEATEPRNATQGQSVEKRGVVSRFMLWCKSLFKR